MKVKRIVQYWLVTWTVVAFAQDYPVGIRSQALGGSGVARATDPEGQLNNPALLAGLSGYGATAFLTHPFGIKEITLSSLSASAKIGRIAMGGAVVRLGQEVFQDQSVYFTLASHALIRGRNRKRQQAPQRVLFGVQGVRRQVQISGYGRSEALLLNAGTVVPISSPVAWGVAFGNLLGAKIGAANESLPRSITVGLSYTPAARFTMQAELYKQSDMPPEWRGGLELVVLPPLTVRVGISDNPDRLTLGMALVTKPAVLHFTTFSHFDLGWSQQFAVTFRIK